MHIRHHRRTVCSAVRAAAATLTACVLAAIPAGAGGASGASTQPAGAIYVWGDNSTFQLGSDAANTAPAGLGSLIPVALTLPSGVSATSVTAGECCVGLAIGTDGDAYDWGSNGGAIGTGAAVNEFGPAPVPLTSGVSAASIAGGIQDGYVVGSDGTVYGWGDNANGELGNGTTAQFASSPVAISLPGGVRATSVAAGQYFALALGANGEVYAWGAGALGNGSDGSEVTTPVEVELPAGVTATAIAAQSDTGEALGSNGEIYTWGSNSYGALGSGVPDTILAFSNVPVQVQMPSGVTAVSIGAESTDGLALGSDGYAYGWGWGEGLGTGDSGQPDSDVPVLMALPAGITATAIAGEQSVGLVLGSNGAVYSWGRPGAHQHVNGLGDDDSANSAQPTPEPVDLPPGDIAVAIGAGWFVGLAIVEPAASAVVPESPWSVSLPVLAAGVVVAGWLGARRSRTMRSCYRRAMSPSRTGMSAFSSRW
jgi:alpha-tubulin suppressor-like RCC1 family protein